MVLQLPVLHMEISGHEQSDRPHRQITVGVVWVGVEGRGSQWFSSYQLSIWKYPDMNKVTDLTGRLQSGIWGCGGGGGG